jgi:dTDP-4-amino-4,6-dideoxygalactose transaminase
MNVYDATRAFEAKIADYTGAPYCVCVDNASNALFLSLMFVGIKGKKICIPNKTYMSVPCEIIHAGGKVCFLPIKASMLKGAYQLLGTKVWDSALRFTANMYIPGSFMCCSFTGPYKHLKLGKGGCILTDNEDAYKWFKRARFSGRNEVSYHEDTFDMIGWNMYMLPEIAIKGLREMQQFYNLDGTKKDMPDLELPYPDLSKFKIYTNGNTKSK